MRGVLGVGEDGDGDGGECASLALFDNFDQISKYCRFSGMKKALGLTAESKVLLVRSNIYKQFEYLTNFFDISIFDHFFQYLYVSCFSKESNHFIIITDNTPDWCFPLIAFTCRNTVKNIFFLRASHVMGEGNFVRTIDRLGTSGKC